MSVHRAMAPNCSTALPVAGLATTVILVRIEQACDALRRCVIVDDHQRRGRLPCCHLPSRALSLDYRSGSGALVIDSGSDAQVFRMPSKPRCPLSRTRRRVDHEPAPLWRRERDSAPRNSSTIISVAPPGRSHYDRLPANAQQRSSTSAEPRLAVPSIDKPTLVARASCGLATSRSFNQAEALELGPSQRRSGSGLL
jgi:hypothetical protein